MLNRKVLVLNSAYEPIGFTSVKQVLKKLVGGTRLLVESYYPEPYRSLNHEFSVPSVIRLPHYISLQRVSKKSFSRKEIYERDDYICVYCGTRTNVQYLTLDHIIPKSRGGTNEYHNLATACQPCNNKKGDRTPDEARLQLQKKIPRRYNPVLAYVSRHGQYVPDWQPYLYV